MCRTLLRAAELAASVVTMSGSMLVGTAVSTVSGAVRADTVVMTAALAL